MARHVVSIGRAPALIRRRDGCIEITVEGEPKPLRLHPRDLGTLIIDQGATSVTAAAVGTVVTYGGSIVWTDERHLPVAITVPLIGHFVQTERVQRQARFKVPARKRVWQHLVRSKIAGQAFVLETLSGSDHGLRRIIAQVRSGDSTKREAVASRRYWRKLLGPAFRRDPYGDEPNARLNYGYAIVRAEVARRISASGLHLSLGISHHNRYDPMPLASDLMEPFRPAVDFLVASETDNYEAPFSTAEKRRLVVGLLAEPIAGLSGTLPAAVERLVVALAAIVDGDDRKLETPSWSPEASNT